MSKIALFASALAACALGVSAAAASDSREFVFKYALDRDALGSRAGAETVYQDLRNAARRACTPDTSILVKRVPDRACMARLVDGVIVSADSAELAAIHNRVRTTTVAALATR